MRVRCNLTPPQEGREVLTRPPIWTSLEDILLSVKKQSQKDKHRASALT